MLAKRLTDVAVQRLRPRAKPYVVWDGRGFGLRVGAQRKTWVAVYRRDGRQRWAVLGTYPALSLADARIAHAHLLADLETGKDPRETLRHPDGLTVADMVADYLRIYARPRKRSAGQDEALMRPVLAAWGSRLAAEITRRDVVAFGDQLAAAAPVRANRVLAVLRRVYSWAVSREMVPSSPCVALEMPGRETPRDRALSIDELRLLWPALCAAPAWDRPAGVLRLVLLTAQRPGEVGSLRWDSIDVDGRLWTVPSVSRKDGREHRVPLSPAALDTIRAAQQVRPDRAYPLGNPATGRPYAAHAAQARIRTLCSALRIPRATPHDLRRTAATGLASLGTPRLIVSRILGHADPSITAVYDRYAYEPEMRAALERWAKRLQSLAG